MEKVEVEARGQRISTRPEDGRGLEPAREEQMKRQACMHMA